MRQIKFRAWNPANEEMVYFRNERLCDDEYQRQHLARLMAGRYGDLLMQFTGMTDIKGVEIYEGDIVVCRYDEQTIIQEPVVYDSGYGYSPIQETVDYDGICTDKWEVIGNIYQHPELLPHAAI